MRVFKFLIVMTCILLLCLNAQAQQEIKLQINHLLGEEAFQFNTTAENNIGQTFDVIRMEYYLSDFSITHDGGLVTELSDAYVLANAEDTEPYSLGAANFTDIEAISFRIGVDSLNNHADPSSWPSDHPLAPQNPSTHWGWASGYRFVMMEGNGGIQSADNPYEIHGLGDQHYKGLVTINVTPIDEGAYTHISINADYTGALYNINVSSGLINHGFDEEAAEIINNLKNHVFSEVEISTGINLLEKYKSTISVSPNPVIGQELSFSYSTESSQKLRVILSDLNGKVIFEKPLYSKKGVETISVNALGNYVLSLLSDENVLSTAKVSID